MKKTFIWGAMVVAAIALVSCNKEQDVKNEDPLGIPYEIIAGTEETRTVNNEMTTEWKEGDKINLFHAVNGADPYSYNYDGAFTATADGASVKFNGTLGSALEGESHYDWYALYPYVDDTHNTPAQFDYITIGSDADGAQQQVGNDSKAHLAGVGYPLWGKKTNLAASTKPAINMKQMTAIIAVKVTNTIDDAITVSKVDFSCSSEGDLIGEYRVNFSGNNPVFETATTNNIATLNVSEAAALAKTEYAVYYLAVKPFTATAGSKLEIGIYTNKGTQVLANIVPSNFNFNAGKIYTLDCSFTNKDVDLAEFKYNDATWLAGQGISLPEAGSSTNLDGSVQTVDAIVVTSTDGGTKTRVFNSSGDYDLRVYNGGSLTVAATGDNFISKITIAGKNVTNLGLATANTWTGKSVCVSLPATGTVNINTINVFYQAAEENDHMLVVPETSYSVPFDATSLSIPFYKANVDDMSITSNSQGYTGFSINGNIITVNFSANVSTSSREIVVNVKSVKADFNQDVTISQAGAPATISTLSKNALATVTAKVAALSNNGFVIADNTGAIFVFKSNQNVTIGQTVTVSGTVGAYNKGLQFPSGCTVEKGTEGTYEYGDAISYTATELSTWNNDTNDRLSNFVTMTGVVMKNGNNYDLIIGGGTDANATLYYPISAHTSDLAEGDNVTVTGYAINVMSSKCGIVPTAIVNHETSPKLFFTDVTDVAATGVTNQHLTVTPFHISGWTANVTRTGCVSAASINAGCTEITYSVSANTAASPQSGTIVVTFQKSGESDVVFTINVSQLAAVVGSSYIYTFTSKDWAATLGTSSANWTKGSSGNGFTTGQGIQVTTGTTGANATSPKSFTGVSRIIVTYNTNKSAGDGNISIQVGTNTAKANNAAYGGSGDGRSANYTTTYDYATKQNGNVTITVNTTVNSLWIKSIEIVADSIAN